MIIYFGVVVKLLYQYSIERWTLNVCNIDVDALAQLITWLRLTPPIVFCDLYASSSTEDMNSGIFLLIFQRTNWCLYYFSSINYLPNHCIFRFLVCISFDRRIFNHPIYRIDVSNILCLNWDAVLFLTPVYCFCSRILFL